MNSKLVSQVLAAAAPRLKEGEQVGLATFASVGSLSRKGKVVGVRRMYIAMTGERLLFFEATSRRPGPGVLMSIPAELVRVAEAKEALLTLKVELDIEGQDEGLRFMFFGPYRTDGNRLVSALRGV